MRKVTVLTSIVLGIVVVLVTYRFVRAVVVHGYEDKTAARVISTYRVVSETQATSGSFKDLAESLEQLEFDDPKGHAEYLLSDGDPVEVVVRAGAFDDPLSYAVAAYSDRDWLNLEERSPNDRLPSARWLVIDNQWVKWMEHGKNRSIGNAQGLITEYVARPNLAIPGDRDPRERGSRPLNSNR